MSAKPTEKKPAGVSASRMTKLESSISETNQKVDSIVDAIGSLTEVVSSLAMNRPAVSNKYTESQEQSLGSEGHVEFDDDSPNQVADRPSDIETEVFTSDKLRDMAFNEEMLEVVIHDSSDKDADQVFEIMVQGQSEIFKRGENKKVRRKFVEGLARAKPINYSNEEYLGADGKQHVRYPSHKGLRYPFALVNPKPIDNAWLQSVLAQP